MQRGDVLLAPWPKERCVAMLKAQIADNRQRRRSQPADPTRRIALASAGHLSVVEVRQLRRRLLLGREPEAVIADDYDLTRTQLEAIRRGVWVDAHRRAA